MLRRVIAGPEPAENALWVGELLAEYAGNEVEKGEGEGVCVGDTGVLGVMT